MTSGHKEDAARCREMAARERELAKHESLPRLRDQRLNSAFNWEQLAESSERAQPGRPASQLPDL